MCRGFIAIAEVELRLPGTASLKDRRSALARLRTGIVERFGASVAEVGGRDRAERGDLLVAIALQSQTAADEAITRLERWLEDREEATRLVQARALTPGDVE